MFFENKHSPMHRTKMLITGLLFYLSSRVMMPPWDNIKFRRVKPPGDAAKMYLFVPFSCAHMHRPHELIFENVNTIFGQGTRFWGFNFHLRKSIRKFSSLHISEQYAIEQKMTDIKNSIGLSTWPRGDSTFDVWS